MLTYEVKPYFTAQEYLELERKADYRSEYDHGVIISMAGASLEHKIIAANVSRHLSNQLDDSACFVVSNDMRLSIPQCGKYYYPDVVVICGEASLEDDVFDTLLNPTLLIEVLSESTEKTNRTEKFDCYATLESPIDYVLISQTEPRIEYYSRLKEGGWHFVVVRGRDTTFILPTIGCSLRLADIYARISFPKDSTAEQHI